MSHKLDEALKHHGVKGMRWGVRRDGSGRVTIRERLGSLTRERQWKKVLKNIDDLSNDDIRTATTRVKLENELKKLSSKSSIATKADKADYIRRADMDNITLSMKVTRLRAKDNLAKEISSASKEQREFGEKVVNAGSSLALTYATTKSITPKDVLVAVKQPKKSRDKALDELLKSVTKPKASK